MSDETTYFTRIDEAECWALLKESEVGRIAWNSTDGLLIVPVNFSVVDGAVVFHTSPTSPLAALAEPTEVAFQADEIDRDSAIGWSVSARGTTGPASPEIANGSWLDGERPVGVELRPTRLAGRVVSGTKKTRSQS